MEIISHQFCIYLFPFSASGVVAEQSHPSELIFGLIKEGNVSLISVSLSGVYFLFGAVYRTAAVLMAVK